MVPELAWPGQIAPRPRWPGARQTPASSSFYPLLFAFGRIPKLSPICCRNPKPSPSSKHQFFNPLLFAFGRIPKLSPICCRNPKPSQSTKHQIFNPPLLAFGRIPKLSPICCKNPKPFRSTKHQFYNAPLFAFGRIPKLSPICCKNPKNLPKQQTPILQPSTICLRANSETLAEFRNSRRFAAKILDPPKEPSIDHTS